MGLQPAVAAGISQFRFQEKRGKESDGSDSSSYSRNPFSSDGTAAYSEFFIELYLSFAANPFSLSYICPFAGYSCALVGDILLQGHLYITENYFAFYSNVFGYVTKVRKNGAKNALDRVTPTLLFDVSVREQERGTIPGPGRGKDFFGPQVPKNLPLPSSQKFTPGEKRADSVSRP